MLFDSSNEKNLDVLLRRCRNGDTAAWAALVERFQAHVYGAARRCGLSIDDAEDVMQMAFVALYKNLDRIQHGATIARWLLVTTTREGVRRARIARKNDGPRFEQVEGLDQMIAVDEASADEIAEGAETIYLVRSQLSKLTHRCRDLLSAIYDAEEPSYQEISERLDIPMGSIGPTRARCLAKLREKLVETGAFHDVSTEDDGASVREKSKTR